MARKKLKTPGLFWRDDSRFIQCTYKSGGKWVNETTKETQETKAREYLDLRKADAVRGIPIHRYKRTDFNEAFYGAGATPQGIVLDGKFTSDRSKSLRDALARP